MLLSESLKKAMNLSTSMYNEADLNNEVDFFTRFSEALFQNHYKNNLKSMREKSNGKVQDDSGTNHKDSTKSQIPIQRAGRPRSATMPNSKPDLLNLNTDKYVNELYGHDTYSSLFWCDGLKSKEHKNFVGYDEDFGPLFVSILSQENAHIVYLNSNWGSSKVLIDNAMIAPSNVNLSQILTPRAYKIILFLAFEKYLEELENELFKLKSWQQSIDFLSPCYGDNTYKFSNDKRAYQRDFLQEIDSNVTLFQLIKSDLPRFVGQLEMIESEHLERTLKNLDRKIMQKCLYVDIIIHHSGLNRTMEQRDTFNAFLKLCGEPLVQNGSSITREELINPTIISESSEDPSQLLARRNIIFQELLDSEIKYVNKLKAIVEVFIKPLRDIADKGGNLIRHYDIKATFQYIEEILEVNEAFLSELKSYDPATSNLGGICLKHMSRFGIYEQFISGYRYSLEYNVAQERKNNFYFNFVMKARDHPDCFKLALKDLLVMPVQRIPRYNLLFSDYLRFTPREDPEYDLLYKALAKVNEISYLASHKISEKAEELSRLLFSIADCPPKIMSSSRHFVTQFDCVESDITTLSSQDNITLFLLSDCLIVTKRNKDSSSTKKKSFSFISWIDLNGLEILDAESYGNWHALYFKVSLEYSEDLYWDHQEIHMFATTDSSDKARFYNEVVSTTAICRAKKNGSSCYRHSIKDLDIFFNIYKPELYEQSLHKNDIVLHYVEDSMIPITKYFQNPPVALVNGMIKAKDCRFSCCLRSRPSCTDILNLIPEEHYSYFFSESNTEEGKIFQLPFMFQDSFYQTLIFHKIALKASLQYKPKLQTYHRILLESLYGLHFPSSRTSHQYLSKIKTFSRKVKGDKFVLVSNGLANVNTIVRKIPYKQAQHQLGTNNSDHFRELGPKSRSMTDPLKSFPSMIDRISATARKVTPTKIKVPKNGPIPPTLSPISPVSIPSPIKNESIAEIQKEKTNSAGRKKRSSFIKVTRFFSWNR